MDQRVSVSRRRLLRTAMASAVVAGAGWAVEPVSAQSDTEGEIPDFEELENVDGGIADLRGQDEVTVDVGVDGNGGVLAFSPAGIWVDPGTTVTWEWTGEGGAHNVAAVDGPAALESELSDETGFTYEFEFTEDHVGITNYQCEPHAALGMLGAVAVGDDASTTDRANDSDETEADSVDETEEPETDGADSTETTSEADSVDETEEPETDSADSTETTSEKEADDDAGSGSTSNDTPGFGIVGTLAGIAGASHLLRDRQSDDTSS